MQLVNTYKNTLNQTLDNAWIKDYADKIAVCGDMEV